jgi:DNA repair exonuclease SbcCD ATPase subunit
LNSRSTHIAKRYSLKNNFNENKLKRHLEYIDARIKEYEDLLDTCDKVEDRKQIETKLAERKEKRAKYQRVQEESLPRAIRNKYP